MCARFDHPQRAFGRVYRCTKFGWNRCSSFDNTQVLIFIAFGLKMPVHGPKIRLFLVFDPVNGHIPREIHVIRGIDRLDRSTCFCTGHRSVPILYNGPPLYTSKLPLPIGGSGPQSNTWFLGPTQAHTTGLGWAQGLHVSSVGLSDRQTIHATRSVTIGHLCTLYGDVV